MPDFRGCSSYASHKVHVKLNLSPVDVCKLLPNDNRSPAAFVPLQVGMSSDRI